MHPITQYIHHISYYKNANEIQCLYMGQYTISLFNVHKTSKCWKTTISGGGNIAYSCCLSSGNSTSHTWQFFSNFKPQSHNPMKQTENNCPMLPKELNVWMMAWIHVLLQGWYLSCCCILALYCLYGLSRLLLTLYGNNELDYAEAWDDIKKRWCFVWFLICMGQEYTWNRLLWINILTIEYQNTTFLLS